MSVDDMKLYLQSMADHMALLGVSVIGNCKLVIYD